MREVLAKYMLEELPGVKFDDEYKIWLETFNLKVISEDALTELIDIVRCSNFKQRCAYFDLLRLLALEENIARRIFSKHWEKLVDDIIVDDYSDTTDKLT